LEISEAKKRIETELKIQGKSQRTARMYCYYNERFLEFIKKDVEQITTEDIKSYLAELMSKGNNPASVGLAKSALAFFYDGMMEKGIMAKIKTPKRQRPVPDVLTKEEVKKLIENAGSLRNRLLVEIMYASGLRVSECASLKVEDLNLEEKMGLLKRGKGGKDRFFILSEQLVIDLKEYLAEKAEGPYLFPGETPFPVPLRVTREVHSVFAG